MLKRKSVYLKECVLELIHNLVNVGETCWRLIEPHEGKIRAKIGEVWGA